MGEEDGEGRIREMSPEIFESFLTVKASGGLSPLQISEAMATSRRLFLRLNSTFDMEISPEPFGKSTGPCADMILQFEGLNYNSAQLAGVLGVELENGVVPDAYVAVLLRALEKFIILKESSETDPT